MNSLPDHIAPTYLGLKKILTQEKFQSSTPNINEAFIIPKTQPLGIEFEKMDEMDEWQDIYDEEELERESQNSNPHFPYLLTFPPNQKAVLSLPQFLHEGLPYEIKKKESEKSEFKDPFPSTSSLLENPNKDSGEMSKILQTQIKKNDKEGVQKDKIGKV